MFLFDLAARTRIGDPDPTVDTTAEPVPYTIIDADTGQVLEYGHGQTPPKPGEGQRLILAQAPENSYYNPVLDQFIQLVPRPTDSPESYEFDWHFKRWRDTRNLEYYKRTQWALIKQARDAVEFGPFEVPPLGVFDGDAESQAKIMGSAVAASLDPAGFIERWTLADNTVATLDAAAMLAVAQAMRAGISAAHERGRVLRAAIEAATTVPEVEAVIW